MAGADRQRGGQVRLAAAGLADQDDLLAVVDPGPFGQRGDRGLRHGGSVVEVKVLQSLDDREAGVKQAAAFAAFGAFGDL